MAHAYSQHPYQVALGELDAFSSSSIYVRKQVLYLKKLDLRKYFEDMPEPILHIPWFLLMVLLPLKQHSGGTHREVYVQCHVLTNNLGLFSCLVCSRPH